MSSMSSYPSEECDGVVGVEVVPLTAGDEAGCKALESSLGGEDVLEAPAIVEDKVSMRRRRLVCSEPFNETSRAAQFTISRPSRVGNDIEMAFSFSASLPTFYRWSSCRRGGT